MLSIYEALESGIMLGGGLTRAEIRFTGYTITNEDVLSIVPTGEGTTAQY